MRPSAAKALRLIRVPESTIMRKGGWKTAAMFRGYAIDSHKDQQQPIELLEDTAQPRGRAAAARAGTAVSAGGQGAVRV